jgi:hypothetical protein
MGPRAHLNRCGKFRPHRDSIPGPSSPKPVAIPTKLAGPQTVIRKVQICFKVTPLRTSSIRIIGIWYKKYESSRNHYWRVVQSVLLLRVFG